MRIQPLRIAFAFLGLVCLAPPRHARADVVAPPPVRLRIAVDKDRDTERQGLKQSSRRLDGEFRKRRVRATDHITERIRARLDIRNLTPHTLREIEAEIVFLADARPDWRKAVHVQQGRQTLRIGEIPGLGRAQAESEAVEYATKRTVSGGRQSKGRETGREFAGVAVRLTREGSVIAEAFSPTSRGQAFRDVLSWQPPGKTPNRGGP